MGLSFFDIKASIFLSQAGSNIYHYPAQWEKHVSRKQC